MKKKDFFCVIAILIFSLVLISGTVFAVDDTDGTSPSNRAGSISWSLEDGTLTISGEGAMEDYVTASDSPWYSDRASITGVVVGDQITHIGDRAFYNCSNLSDVDIGSAVTSIGPWAFCNDSSLAKVTVPATVDSIGNSCFRGCSSLSKVLFEGNAPSLGTSVFQNTAGDFEINHYDNSTGWDSEAWSSFTVTTVHVFTAEEIISEVSCTEPGIKRSYCKNCGQWLEEEQPALGHDYVDGVCSRCGDIEILGSGSYWTLYGSGRLELTEIPSFSDAESVPWFEHRDRVKQVVFKSSISSIGDYAFYGCGLTEIVIPDSVDRIGEYAFSACSDLTEVTIPEGVASVGTGAFSDCSGLTEATIPESMTVIGDSVFKGCIKLAGFTIPDSVTSIGDNAFNGCSSITEIIVPDSVTSIGKGAFGGCSNLTAITVPFVGGGSSSNSYIGHIFGAEKSGTNEDFVPKSLRKVAVSSKATTIPEKAFFRCFYLTEITFTDKVTSIGEGAFHSCYALREIRIPDSVTSMGRYQFIDCSRSLVVDTPRDSHAYLYALYYKIKVKEKADITKCKIDGIKTMTYTGDSIEQKLTVSYYKDYPENNSLSTDPHAITLLEGLDYEVTYKDNINAGTATVTIKGIGNYTGVREEKFKINKVSLAKATVSGVKAKTYTGSGITQAPVVNLGTRKLKSGTDYSITYKNNKAVGKATMVITGKGSYTGSISKTFSVLPKGTTIVTPVASTKAFTAKWKKQATKMPKYQITGYQVQYSTDKTFKKGVKTVSVKGASSVSRKVSKLYAKKTYYIRVRTYMKLGAITYHSTWSAVKSVKTK